MSAACPHASFVNGVDVEGECVPLGVGVPRGGFVESEVQAETARTSAILSRTDGPTELILEGPCPGYGGQQWLELASQVGRGGWLAVLGPVQPSRPRLLDIYPVFVALVAG